MLSWPHNAGKDAPRPHNRGLDSVACISNSFCTILYPRQLVYINTFLNSRILIISFCIAAVVEQKPPKQGVRLWESQFSGLSFIHVGNGIMVF